jgi:hypothetical protein
MHFRRSLAATAVLALFATAASAQSATTNPPGRANLPGPDTAGLTACMGEVGAARDDCMRSLPSRAPTTAASGTADARAGGTSSSPQKGTASGGDVRSDTGTSSSPAAGTANRGVVRPDAGTSSSPAAGTANRGGAGTASSGAIGGK